MGRSRTGGAGGVLRRALGILAVLAAPALPVPAISAGPSESPRTLPVTVVTDPAFRDFPQWRGLARAAVQRATEDLTDYPGLRFRVVREVSLPGPGATEPGSLEGVLEHVVNTVDRRDGILAVFLGQRPVGVTDVDEMGLAYLGRPALVVLAPDRVPSRDRLLEHLALFFRHEVGHVFGLPHIGGRSVMSPTPDRMISEFGELGLEVLRANRNIDFESEAPFQGCDLETLRDVYLLLHRRGDMETGLLINLGIALSRDEDYGSARTIYEAARDRDPRMVGAHLGLIECTLALGDTAAARSLTADLDPVSSWSADEAAWLGSLFLDLGDPSRAHALFSDAADREPERFGFRFNRGLASYRMARFPAAAEDFRKAIELDPRRPEAWFNLALALDGQEHRDDAVRAFREFLELDPDGPRSSEARSYIEKHR